jgi:alpha-mannosidase
VDCEVRLYVVQPRSGNFLVSLKPTFDGLLHVDIPFGVEPRVPVSEPYGIDNVERGEFQSFWGYSWADLSDGRCGVAIFAEPGEQGYRWRDGRLEHFLLKTIAPDNLRGKRWTTKSRTGLGYQDIRFAVFLHEGDWRSARLYREVELYRQPLDAQDVLCRLDGELPDTARGLAVSPGNVMLSGVFADGEDFVLRIYENAGQQTTAQVELPFAPNSVEVTDLLCRPAGDERQVPMRGPSLSIELAPWEIVTLRLRTAEP